MQCMGCNNEASYIEEHQQYYCYTCEKYLGAGDGPPAAAHTCQTCGSEIHFIEEHGQWYCYTCAQYLGVGGDSGEVDDELILIHVPKVSQSSGNKQLLYHVFLSEKRILFVSSASAWHIFDGGGAPISVIKTAAILNKKVKARDNTENLITAEELVEKNPEALCVWKENIVSLGLKSGGVFDACLMIEHPPQEGMFGKPKKVVEKYYFKQKYFDDLYAVIQEFYGDKLGM